MGASTRPAEPQGDAALLILASASPRRRALLADLGVRFEVVPVDVDEAPQAGEDAPTYTRRLAREKARAAMRGRPGAWILAADTTVEIDGTLLGKPADATEAGRMLRRLSGQLHRVCTAVALLAPDGAARADEAAVTAVAFRRLSAHEIDAYAATGEPLDKAGAYAVQGGAAGFVERIDGSYSNVVGLPLEVVRPLLIRSGLLRG